ncbi:hypothetical protein MBLNU459_g2600t1 [Dothideomycetes sp. NU459]
MFRPTSMISDLSLPDHIPDMDQHRKDLIDGRPFAVYSLVPAAAADLEAICYECNSDCDLGTAGVEPAPISPRTRFVGRPLSEVAEFHRSLIKQTDFDRFFFVAIHEEQWGEKGVLLVTLDADGRGKPASFCIAAGDAGRVLVTFQTGMSSWAEGVENYELDGVGSASPDYSADGDEQEESGARKRSWKEEEDEGEEKEGEKEEDEKEE